MAQTNAWLSPRFTNLASLSLIASTFLEKKVGFWAAYLLPVCTIWALVPLLLFWSRAIGKYKNTACLLRDPN